MCESLSGGSRTTIAPFVVIDHPAGTVNVTPAAVARGESCSTFSSAPRADPGEAAGVAAAGDSGEGAGAAMTAAALTMMRMQVSEVEVRERRVMAVSLFNRSVSPHGTPGDTGGDVAGGRVWMNEFAALRRRR